MDKIRQDILHEQEVRKSKLAAHFGQSFSPNGTVNEDGRDIETTATKSANEVRKEIKRQSSVIKAIDIDSTSDALDILKGAGTEDLFEKAKHQDGDMHPNGKWVWVASAAGGKGDWRTLNGRVHKKSQAGASASSSSTSNGASTSQATQTSQAKPAKKETTVDTLKLESKNGFKFKSDSNYRMRYNKREKAYEIWKEGDVYGTKTAIMSIKSDNENIGGDIIKHIQKKYPKKGSTISYLAVTYGF